MHHGTARSLRTAREAHAYSLGDHGGEGPLRAPLRYVAGRRPQLKQEGLVRLPDPFGATPRVCSADQKSERRYGQIPHLEFLGVVICVTFACTQDYLLSNSCAAFMGGKENAADMGSGYTDPSTRKRLFLNGLGAQNSTGIRTPKHEVHISLRHPV
jgi:hypothetical protein